MTNPRMYDIAIDGYRDVTQADIDRVFEIFSAMTKQNKPMESAISPDKKFNFKLACFRNPMRDDGVFVAESKTIDPYEGVKGLKGEPLYPATPQTPYSLRSQLTHDFAAEIVRRWNAYSE